MGNSPRIERYFVCIGAQKAGTTWLARALAQHPDLFLTPVKEIHYFDHMRGLTTHLSDRKRRSRYRKYHQRMWTQWHRWAFYRAQAPWYRAYMRDPIDDHWYASLFAERQGRSMAGEITPEYAVIGAEGLRHIHRLAPDARVIYIMREPVARAWSQILHQCRVRSIDAAKADAEQLIALTKMEGFAAHGDYPAALDALGDVFAESQTHLAFYEDIHRDRPAALARICEFLGVSTEACPAGLERRFNISQKVEMPEAVAAYLTAHYAALAKDIENRLGAVPDAWVKRFAP